MLADQTSEIERTDECSVEEIEETSSHKAVEVLKVSHVDTVQELTDDDAVHRLDKSEASHSDIETFRLKKPVGLSGQLYSAKTQIKSIKRGRMPNYNTAERNLYVKFRGRSSSSH